MCFVTKSGDREVVRQQMRDERRANRPPDAVVDQVSVIMLDLENRAKAEMDRRDAREAILKAEIDQVESVKAILIGEVLAEQQTIRRLTLICVVLFCALCWLEGWRVATWIWRWL